MILKPNFLIYYIEISPKVWYNNLKAEALRCKFRFAGKAGDFASKTPKHCGSADTYGITIAARLVNKVFAFLLFVCCCGIKDDIQNSKGLVIFNELGI